MIILSSVCICPCGYPLIHENFIVTVFARLPLSVASETCWCCFCLCQFLFPQTHSKSVPLNQKKAFFLCSIFNLLGLHMSTMVQSPFLIPWRRLEGIPWQSFRPIAHTMAKRFVCSPITYSSLRSWWCNVSSFMSTPASCIQQMEKLYVLLFCVLNADSCMSFCNTLVCTIFVYLCSNTHSEDFQIQIFHLCILCSH